MIHISIINDRGIVNNIHGLSGGIIAGIRTGVDITAGNKCPPGIRHIISRAEREIDTDTGAHWRPAIVSTALTPVYPSRPPGTSGNPYPAIIGTLRPTAVVERRPSPGIVRNPHIAIFGHYPMAIGIIGTEITSCVRGPYITILRIVQPLAVRREVVVELLVISVIIIGITIIVVIIIIVVVVLGVNISNRKTNHHQQNSKDKSRYSACPVAEHFHNYIF